jgi:hypothetical protein
MCKTCSIMWHNENFFLSLCRSSVSEFIHKLIFFCMFAITLQSCINVHINANNSISLCWFCTCLVPSDLKYPSNRFSKVMNFNISGFQSFVITIITHFSTVVLTFCGWFWQWDDTTWLEAASSTRLLLHRSHSAQLGSVLHYVRILCAVWNETVLQSKIFCILLK